MGKAMNDQMRVSDADRERVAEELREHYAQGRLSAEELDQRITVTLGAKTVRDLRSVMTDLPGPEVLAPQPGQFQPNAAWSGPAVRRRSRLLPLAALAFILALAVPGVAWIFFAVIFALVHVLFLLGFVAFLAGVVLFAGVRSGLRRRWQP
jgi:hypothetical protein